MELKHFIAAAATALLMQSASAQARIDADSAKKTAAVSYWKTNPAALFRYTSPARHEVGALHKFSFGEIKAAAAKEHGKEALGVYYENLLSSNSRKRFFSAGFERIRGRKKTLLAVEAHAIMPFSSHNIFAGYANTSGSSATALGDFFNYGKMHFGAVAAARASGSAERFYKTYTGALFFGVENRYKGFLRFGNANASYTGFLRFGESDFKRTFTPNAFYFDRKNLAQQLFRRVRNEDFDAPLPNIHPSEMGHFVLVTRYNRTSEKNSQNLEIYDTEKFHNCNFIFGTGMQRDDSGAKTRYTANAYLGAALGPIRVIAGFGSSNGVYLSYIKKK